MPSAGKSSPNAKRGKKCTLCQAREKAQPVSNVGKSSPSAEPLKAKRGKKFIEHKAKENIYPSPSTYESVPRVERVKNVWTTNTMYC